MHKDHGSLPMDQLFARAIEYAENGYPVTPRVAMDWAANADIIGGDEHAAKLFLPEGKAPKAGDMHAQPLLAESLRIIAKNGAAGFYEGDVAAKMVGCTPKRISTKVGIKRTGLNRFHRVTEIMTSLNVHRTAKGWRPC